MHNSQPSFAMNHIRVDIADLSSISPDYDDLLILPTRNLVLFPGVHQSLRLGREASVRLAEYAERTHTPIGVVCQKETDIENPSLKQLNRYGVVAHIIKVVELPDGNKTALLQAGDKFKIKQEAPGAKLPGNLAAVVQPIHEAEPRTSDINFQETVKNIISISQQIIEKTYDGPGNPLSFGDNDSATSVINNVATNLPIAIEHKFDLLRTPRLRERATMLLSMLTEQIERIDISREIMDRARQGLEDNQRNVFLKQQLDVIREELYGDENEDVKNFTEKLAAISDANVTEALSKEINKLQRIHPQSPDYSVQYSYLDLALSLPWNKKSKENKNFNKAEKILSDEHYAMEKVKERITEHVAMLMKFKTVHKTPILCLVGPPGVGKTSIGKSIAHAMGREYQRVALGGLHDEAEIRGHRRTYIGAMPGRIVDALKRAGKNNPVIVLDEIDKIGADHKGDPTAALLEVLDPEQNSHFHDNYVDIDIDLSPVLFVATANTLDGIPRPLLDRIEVINVPGYITGEKIEIAKRHLIPSMLGQYGASNAFFSMTDDALEYLIENYTAESGVRQLDKKLNSLFRKTAVSYYRKTSQSMPLKPENVAEMLGKPEYRRDKCLEKSRIGVVTGLAWTQVGGEILLVEVSRNTNGAPSAGKLTLTGNLGDVMKESAAIALQWVKANANKIGIDEGDFSKYDIHLHFPEGAIPKDGPSAGITITTALISLFTQKSVMDKLAMTGEMTLRGDVLPVGGIREKILAAKRAGITRVILCKENKRDVDEIPADYITGMEIKYADTMHDVLHYAFDQ